MTEHTEPTWRVTWRPSELDYLIERDDVDPLVVVRPRLSQGEEGRHHAELVATTVALTLATDIVECADCMTLFRGPGTRCLACAVGTGGTVTSALIEAMRGARAAALRLNAYAANLEAELQRSPTDPSPELVYRVLHAALAARNTAHRLVHMRRVWRKERA